MKLIFTLLILLGLSSHIYAQKIYATVNGSNITIEDINYMLKSFGEKRPFSALPKEQRNLIIAQAVENKLLIEKAKKDGIENHPIYANALKDFKRKMLVEVWMKKNFSDLKVNEKALQDYYAKNQAEFKKDDQVKARHIVVETQQEAQDIINQLNKEQGDIQKAFIALAKAKSIGPSAPKGGDLGWFKKGVMLESFWQEAKSLEANSYSKKPIQTRFGHHVIYVDAKQKAYTVNFEDIKEVITQKVKMQQFQSIISKKIESLKKEANISFK